MTPSARESQADHLARHVLNRRLRLRPKENVLIEAYPSALPWAAGFVREARRRGAQALIHYEDETSYWRAIEEGREGLLGKMGDPERAALEKADVYIYFWGPESLARRWRLDDEVAGRATAFNSGWYDLARKAGLRGARMGIARVTRTNARSLGVSYRGWLQEMFDASTRDIGKTEKDLNRVKRALESGGSVRFRHPNGTDLALALRKREARESLGRVTPAEMKTPFGMMTNVPDATTWVAIDEETADGTLVSNRAAWLGGTPRSGGVWRFRDGHLVGSHYKAGGRSFRAGYKAAGKGRDRPAFLEVGLDPSFHVSPLMEEAERGAVTIGVGGNVGFGGATKVDFLEYLTVAGGELLVDDRPIVRAGRVL